METFLDRTRTQCYTRTEWTWPILLLATIGDQMKYRIIKGWSLGERRWRVVNQNGTFVAVFLRKKDAIAWILEQEAK